MKPEDPIPRQCSFAFQIGARRIQTSERSSRSKAVFHRTGEFDQGRCLGRTPVARSSLVKNLGFVPLRRRYFCPQEKSCGQSEISLTNFLQSKEDCEQAKQLLGNGYFPVIGKQRIKYMFQPKSIHSTATRARTERTKLAIARSAWIKLAAPQER